MHFSCHKILFLIIVLRKARNLFIDLFVAFASSHMSTADIEVHARVAYGSSYSPICDMIRLLWSVPHRTSHTQLGPHHESS